MSEIAVLNAGPTVEPARPKFATEDILSDEGGLLKRRGQVVYEWDFRGGYGGWMPIFTAGGTEPTRFPLSLVNFPRSALRMGMAGGSFGQTPNSQDAILRLTRPRAEDMICSFSFRYAMFEELLPEASSPTKQAMNRIVFGVDTQGWDNTERQFFKIEVRRGASQTNDQTYVRLGDNTTNVTVPSDRILNPRLGLNENKMNVGYVRGTFRCGKTPEYIEVQMGGVAADLRGLMTTISEPMQISPTDEYASFRGGWNPFLLLGIDSTLSQIAAAGVYVTDVTVTFGDELA